MFLSSIAFLLGDMFLQNFAEIPRQMFCLSCLVFGVGVFALIPTRMRYSYLPLVFIAGFVYSAWFAQHILSWTLPKNLEGIPLTVSGRISSLIEQDNYGIHFNFDLQTIYTGNGKYHPHALIRLYWAYPKQTLHVGEKYQFQVRLKRIHGTQNPGSFDLESWALLNRLRAFGNIVPGHVHLLKPAAYHYLFQQWREYLQEKIQSVLPPTLSAPWLMVLLIGVRNKISPADWQVLRATGTNHLMAIAGLHIGMVSGMMHLVIAWGWRQIPKLSLWLPAKEAGYCGALVTAYLYSAIAGFSLPTQRACIMLTVWVFAHLLRRNINPWQVWSCALWIVLILNPLNVLSESFWLSFGAIALILYGMGGRLAAHGWWWKWGRVQWVVGIGLLPITLALFQQCSLISCIANSLAIPWLVFTILPLCVLACLALFVSEPFSSFLFMCADKSLQGLWWVLTTFAHSHFASIHFAISQWSLLCLLLVGSLMLLLPAGLPGRLFGILAFVPVFFIKPAKPFDKSCWLTLLDVGQGLAVVIQTKNHALIYDAGPKNHTGYDSGERIVLPFLLTQGIKDIDSLIVSHGDNDHRGGAESIIKTLPVKAVYTSVPERLHFLSQHTSINPCLAGQKWQWDGVIFQFLYPTKENLGLGNNSSCVLSIRVGKKQILLSGDIEKLAEKTLLQNYHADLKSDIFLVPHHGSKTSGVKEFIQAVRPVFALYATGYRNRYRLPHKKIIASYSQIQAHQLNTVNTGAMRFTVDQAGIEFIPYRLQHKRYWMDT